MLPGILIILKNYSHSDAVALMRASAVNEKLSYLIIFVLADSEVLQSPARTQALVGYAQF